MEVFLKFYRNWLTMLLLNLKFGLDWLIEVILTRKLVNSMESKFLSF